ncbi:MAG: lamin tail domain-containing protein [Acidobacteria bacterium]|nr:lamin tail domain-containing protein [Acidobacteriota bacterium]
MRRQRKARADLSATYFPEELIQRTHSLTKLFAKFLMKTPPLTIRFQCCRSMGLRVGATVCALLALVWLIDLFKPSSATTQLSTNVSPQIVISQIYGGGGSSPNAFRHDFVELFNRGSATISLAGWSLQYAPATSGAWQKLDLSGSIAPGQFYLIQLSLGATGSRNLPAPDAFGTIGMDASAGKVVLVNKTLPLENAPNTLCPSSLSQIGIVDYVGYGNPATCFRGNAAAPSAGNAFAIYRKGDGCTDTRNNNADFTTSPPVPRNSASPLKPCSGLIQPKTDIIISTQASVASVQPRGLVSFVIEVLNFGSAPATNIIVTNAIPEGFTNIIGERVIGNNVQFAPIATLQPGQSVSFTITAQAPDVAGQYINRAVANADTFDPNTENNTSLTEIRVVAGAFFDAHDTVTTITSDFQCSSSYTVETILKNSGVTKQNDNSGAEFLARMSPEITAVIGSCVASKGRCRVSELPGDSTVQWNGDVEVGEEIVITYSIVVLGTKKSVVNFCIEQNVYFDANNDNRNETTTTKTDCDSYISTCLYAPPFEPIYPPSSPINSTRAGSILVFNLYSSSATDPDLENTLINITNTADKGVTLHQFFVSGDTCSVSDNFLCLTGNQTTSFLISDVDPDVTGFLIVVAVDDLTGCPINFNFLIGDEYIHLASGHAANLGAEAIAAVDKVPCDCNDTSLSANLLFDGFKYNLIPRVLVVSHLPSFADNNSTLLILNRIGGDLFESVDRIGDFSGLLFDDTEHVLSFVSTGGCQFRQFLNGTFPRTTPRFPQFVPSGHSGWMKLTAQEGVAMLGSMIVLNTEKEALPNAFSGGRNLHRLSFAASAMYLMPVIPPKCG